MVKETEYSNTNFDVKSTSSLDLFKCEMAERCGVLYYTHGDDGNWHLSVEATHDDETSNRNAELDIGAILLAIESLSPVARKELADCFLREFNVGFESGATWAYAHCFPTHVVRGVADHNCSIAVTIYPMQLVDQHE